MIAVVRTLTRQRDGLAEWSTLSVHPRVTGVDLFPVDDAGIQAAEEFFREGIREIGSYPLPPLSEADVQHAVDAGFITWRSDMGRHTLEMTGCDLHHTQ